MSQIDALEQAWKYGAELIASTSAGDLTLATPCTDWDVRALVNHLLGEAKMMTEVNHGLPSIPAHSDLIDGADVETAWIDSAQDNVASWRDAGVTGDRSYFYGTFPATAGLAINVGEVVVHSWDLATALGRQLTTDPEHAAIAFDLWSSFPLDGLRAGGQLGAEIPVPTDAPVMDRLLGLLGRQP
jgi:uncharacterized protein (TIGR03086 family)